MSPSAKAGPSTGGPSESPATTSLLAGVQPPAAVQAPVDMDAQVPSPAAAAASRDGGTAETTEARATDNTRRTVTQGRTKEQAERDAIATQRLIAREFADSPSADSDQAPPPRS